MSSNDYVNTLSVRHLSLYLPGRPLDRQPHSLRSRALHVEERLFADVAGKGTRPGIEPVPLRCHHRHPGPFRRLLGARLGHRLGTQPIGHQLLAMVVGGIAGLIAIIGLTILLHRRLADPRIRLNSRKWDIAVVLMLWLQLALGLLTVPLSAYHMDGALFETLVQPTSKASSPSTAAPPHS